MLNYLVNNHVHYVLIVMVQIMPVKLWAVQQIPILNVLIVDGMFVIQVISVENLMMVIVMVLVHVLQQLQLMLVMVMYVVEQHVMQIQVEQQIVTQQ